MQNRQIELALKKGRLQERIASQRAILAAQAAPIVAAVEATDQAMAVGRAGIDYVKRHPGQVGAVIAALAIMRPKRAWQWGRRAFVAWGLWTKVRSRLEGVGLTPRRGPA